MSQDHNHSGNNKVKDFGKEFAIGISLNVVYIIVEVVYGLIVNSLALITDAGHNFSDVLGLLLAWGASYLVRKSPAKKYTYGFKKLSVLVALLNALILLVAIGAIIWEAVGRFSKPQVIEGQTIMIVAGIGVIINAATAFLFFSGRKQDLNIKGAFLHMAADSGISLGVVFAGMIITFTNFYWLDPLISIAIVLIIFWGTWGLLKNSVNLALDAVPENIDRKAVENFLNSIPEVESIHDLHIWAMSTTETALTVHIIVDKSRDQDQFIEKISKALNNKFSIQHSTMQFENKRDTECQQNQI